MARKLGCTRQTGIYAKKRLLWRYEVHLLGALDGGSSTDYIMSKPICTWKDDIKMNTKNRV
jgi:hypothetical protein